ncbi:MAG: DUF2970 domain-containing protein [Gammaproteobacteria bacterium]|nr:DUF2970 domain-containing protein [Gammaproteobacteria bacterium]
MTSNETNPKSDPSLWQVTKSVFAAFLGVQSSSNYQRDFNYGKPSQYIIIGLIGVALFVLTIVAVVKLVLALATGK